MIDLSERKKLSTIGLGTWGLGGKAYAMISERESREIIRSSLNLGINFFDTADIYGDGLAETLLGNILADCNHDVTITTKGGYTNYSKKSQCFTSDYLLKALERSLKRLRREQVDYYLLHSPPINILESNSLSKTIEVIRKSNLSKYIGVSVKDINDATKALSLGVFDCIEIPFNLTVSIKNNMPFFDKAKSTNVLLMAKYPLNRGFLTDSFFFKKNFRTSDIRANIDKTEYLGLNKLNYKLIKAKQELGRSVLELALQWPLYFRDIMIPIPGVTNLKQLYENIEAANRSCLTLNEINYLEELLFDEKI